MPPERSGVLIDSVEVVENRLFELLCRAVDAPPQLLFGDVREEPLNLIEPRSGCRRDVGMPARAAGEPVADHVRLVSGVVVHDDMTVEVIGHGLLDLVEELAEFRAAVAAVASADDLAGRDVKRSKQ